MQDDLEAGNCDEFMNKSMSRLGLSVGLFMSINKFLCSKESEEKKNLKL